tara:strand:- start:1372 stop:1737 length:366 start_codon:yes stop_codon:yes gene_type:complete
MTTPFNTTVDLIPAEKVNGETVIPFTPSPQRVELELTLARLAEDNADDCGTDYPEDLVDILTYGRNAARKQGQNYITKHGNRGFSWGTNLGKYTCTKNAEENKLYVNFTTWADIKEANNKF